MDFPNVFNRALGSNLTPRDKESFETIRREIDRCTDEILLQPDWGANLSCCDAINSATSQAVVDEAFVAIRRKFSSRAPNVTLVALHLAESIVKNCGERAHRAANDESFMKEMAKVAKKFTAKKGDSNAREVSELSLDIIQAWGEAFLPKSKTYPNFVKTYHELRKEGLPFRPQYDENRVPVFTPPPVIPDDIGFTQNDYYESPDTLMDAELAAALALSLSDSEPPPSSQRQHQHRHHSSQRGREPQSNNRQHPPHQHQHQHHHHQTQPASPNNQQAVSSTLTPFHQNQPTRTTRPPVTTNPSSSAAAVAAPAPSSSSSSSSTSAAVNEILSGCQSTMLILKDILIVARNYMEIRSNEIAEEVAAQLRIHQSALGTAIERELGAGTGQDLETMFKINDDAGLLIQLYSGLKSGETQLSEAKVLLESLFPSSTESSSSASGTTTSSQNPAPSANSDLLDIFLTTPAPVLTPALSAPAPAPFPAPFAAPAPVAAPFAAPATAPPSQPPKMSTTPPLPNFPAQSAPKPIALAPPPPTPSRVLPSSLRQPPSQTPSSDLADIFGGPVLTQPLPPPAQPSSAVSSAPNQQQAVDIFGDPIPSSSSTSTSTASTSSQNIPVVVDPFSSKVSIDDIMSQPATTAPPQPFPLQTAPPPQPFPQYPQYPVTSGPPLLNPYDPFSFAPQPSSHQLPIPLPAPQPSQPFIQGYPPQPSQPAPLPSTLDPFESMVGINNQQYYHQPPSYPPAYQYPPPDLNPSHHIPVPPPTIPQQSHPSTQSNNPFDMF